MHIISDARTMTAEGDRIVAGICHGDHEVVVSDRQEGNSHWREYVFGNDIAVRLMSQHGWHWTKHPGDYDDWQVRDGVEKAAALCGISVPDNIWYEG